MKRFIGIPIATLMMTASQASVTLTSGEYYTEANHYVTQHPTVIQKGPALAKSRIPKPKIFRSNPHRISHFIGDPDDDVFVQDDDLITTYRRRDLTKIEHPDGISEKVRWRLFLARQMALFKYREKFGTKIS